MKRRIEPSPISPNIMEDSKNDKRWLLKVSEPGRGPKRVLGAFADLAEAVRRIAQIEGVDAARVSLEMHVSAGELATEAAEYFEHHGHRGRYEIISV
jgi:hypothetical protein